MQEVKLFDAKTHLSQLVNDVYQHQEGIVITRRGEKVAILMPYLVAHAASVEQVLSEFRAFKKTTQGKITQTEIKRWKQEGQK